MSLFVAASRPQIDHDKLLIEMKRHLKKNYKEKIKTWKPVPTLKRHRWFTFKELFTSLQLRKGYRGNDPVW